MSLFIFLDSGVEAKWYNEKKMDYEVLRFGFKS